MHPNACIFPTTLQLLRSFCFTHRFLWACANGRIYITLSRPCQVFISETKIRRCTNFVGESSAEATRLPSTNPLLTRSMTSVSLDTPPKQKFVMPYSSCESYYTRFCKFVKLHFFIPEKSVDSTTELSKRSSIESIDSILSIRLDAHPKAKVCKVSLTATWRLYSNRSACQIANATCSKLRAALPSHASTSLHRRIRDRRPPAIRARCASI